jgi:phage shock protein A
MGFFERIANLWTGFLSLWVSDVESKNPEVVYEAAINERIKKHKELKKAVSNIVYLRNKLQEELVSKEAEFKEVSAQIPVAVEEGEDEAALILIQKRDELAAAIESLSAELAKVETQAEEAKGGLLQFQGEIEKLRREKDQMLAARANAQARIQIQENLSGLSTEADIAALDNVRQSIHKLRAEADVGAELEGSGLDAKLKKIRERTASSSAKTQLEELKRQSAARKSGAAEAAGAVKKTM